MTPLSTHHTLSSFEHLFFHSPDTYVHPTAIVGPNVTLGEGTKIGPHAVITGTVSIGPKTQIHAHCMVGSTAQDITVRAPLGRVEIGASTVIKEFATVSASKTPDGVTRIGNNCILMHFAHVGHDATLEDNVVLTNNAQLAGHSYIEHHAVIMAHVGIHQRCRVGSYSALAPHAGARQDIPPYCLFVGQPARFAGLNRILLKRAGMSKETIAALKTVTTWFYQEKLLLDELTARVAQKPWAHNEAVTTFTSFITNSSRGVSRQRITE